MTEEEAKTKWCPFTRFIDIPFLRHASSNRVDSVDDFANPVERGVSRCIGSACMAWRWWDANANHEVKHEQGSDGDAFWVKRTFSHAPSGYCGLAGRVDG